MYIFTVYLPLEQLQSACNRTYTQKECLEDKMKINMDESIVLLHSRQPLSPLTRMHPSIETARFQRHTDPPADSRFMELLSTAPCCGSIIGQLFISS